MGRVSRLSSCRWRRKIRPVLLLLDHALRSAPNEELASSRVATPGGWGQGHLDILQSTEHSV